MSKYIAVLCFMLFANNRLYSQQSLEKPKLVVGIIVDQMRQEYLYRYYDKFEDDGFKKLMDQGFVANNTHYNYIPTKTAPGHASVYTGSTPRYHGIIANSWYDRKEKKELNNVDDYSVQTVGSSSLEGERSPSKLLATTITDELQLSNNGKSKVISISLKDRGAILPGGHMADGAYWFDGNTGKFISSTYYMKDLPEWVEHFNGSRKADSLLRLGWDTLLPIEKYAESNGDDHPYEEGFPGKKKATFPYKFNKLSNNDKFDQFMKTPYGNTITRLLAEEAIRNEELGQSSTTDFLAISFSSTDKVGHAFGPQSVEVEDTYLRLDRDIAHLLHTLDKLVGKDQYTLFLTADHAGADTSPYLKEISIPTGYYNDSQMLEELNGSLMRITGVGNLIENLSNNQIFLDRRLIEDNNLDYDQVAGKVEKQLLKMQGVSDVILGSELRSAGSSEKIRTMAQLGYNVKRSGDIVIILEPAWSKTRNYGTEHGSPYNYDTHVPLIWFGDNIPKGETLTRYNITDIAPTISAMLHIKFPSACIGNPISELFIVQPN